MKVFHMIMALPELLLSKLFPFLTYKSVINTQIAIYNRLKRREPGMSENDLLNHLIISRIEAPPRVTSKEEEYTHYKPLLENPNKTLVDVILAIVEYENILSRSEYVFNRLSKMGLSPLEALAEIENFKGQVAEDISESIKKKVKKREEAHSNFP